MSEQIREQVSAFLDGELPSSEMELLLKRMTRDAELRESFGRYALVGECMRGSTAARLSKNFGARINQALDGGSEVQPVVVERARGPRWWRPFAGAAVAAGVAAVAVVGLQQRAVAPTLRAALPLTAMSAAAPGAVPATREAVSYTTPPSVADAPAALPAARLTNYVFAHSKYSSVLGQSNVLSGLLADGDEQTGGNTRAVSEVARHKLRPEANVSP